MNEFEKVLKKMDFEYFGTGQHKMEAKDFLQTENTLLLDVRCKEEIDTVKLNLRHHCSVLEIPTKEIPEKINKIPKDKLVGVFCSSGVRCVMVFAYLLSKGFTKVKIIPGGYTPLIDALKPGAIYKRTKK